MINNKLANTYWREVQYYLRTYRVDYGEKLQVPLEPPLRMGRFAVAEKDVQHKGLHASDQARQHGRPVSRWEHLGNPSLHDEPQGVAQAAAAQEQCAGDHAFFFVVIVRRRRWCLLPLLLLGVGAHQQVSSTPQMQQQAFQRSPSSFYPLTSLPLLKKYLL
jgi:hypothetical protein